MLFGVFLTRNVEPLAQTWIRCECFYSNGHNGLTTPKRIQSSRALRGVGYEPEARAGLAQPIFNFRVLSWVSWLYSKEEFFPFKKGGATRGASACAARATSTNIQSAIFNFQFPGIAGFTLHYGRLVRIRVLRYGNWPGSMSSQSQPKQ
jgi:hypothetical protein